MGFGIHVFRHKTSECMQVAHEVLFKTAWISDQARLGFGMHSSSHVQLHCLEM